jgi:hypothetical protein
LSSKAKTVESLRDYPAVANAFMKANSTLPSSAEVERLFSAAGQILNPRRCSLSDEHFDWMTFIRDRLKKATTYCLKYWNLTIAEFADSL